MKIVQTFYDTLAPQYEKLFQDWQSESRKQAVFLDRLFQNHGFDHTAAVLDCACGIGTQTIGLAELGYRMTASDFSEGAIEEAKKTAASAGAQIRFAIADFCALSQVFSEQFDIIIAMDNALPHMLTKDSLNCAARSIANQIKPGGIFVASIRDYDALLNDQPPYSSPYIHRTDGGQRVSFQTWDWQDDRYKLTQYIIEDEASLQISKFECEYRAVCREELTAHLYANGCSDVRWLMPEETGFYQPIVIAGK